MNPPAGFDALTLNHWLWWKLRCHEGSPEDFQKLFEEVIKRAKPEFIQIRPYGNIGDRKWTGSSTATAWCFRSIRPTN